MLKLLFSVAIHTGFSLDKSCVLCWKENIAFKIEQKESQLTSVAFLGVLNCSGCFSAVTFGVVVKLPLSRDESTICYIQ